MRSTLSFLNNKKFGAAQGSALSQNNLALRRKMVTSDPKGSWEDYFCNLNCSEPKNLNSLWCSALVHNGWHYTASVFVSISLYHYSFPVHRGDTLIFSSVVITWNKDKLHICTHSDPVWLLQDIISLHDWFINKPYRK